MINDESLVYEDCSMTVAKGGADSGSTPKPKGRPIGTKKRRPQQDQSGQFISPTSSRGLVFSVFY